MNGRKSRLRRRQQAQKPLELTVHIPALKEDDQAATLAVLDVLLTTTGHWAGALGPEAVQRAELMGIHCGDLDWERLAAAAGDVAGAFEALWWQLFASPAKPAQLLIGLAPLISVAYRIADGTSWADVTDYEEHGEDGRFGRGHHRRLQAFAGIPHDLTADDAREGTRIWYGHLDRYWWALYESSELFAPSGSPA